MSKLKAKEYIWHFGVTASFEESQNVTETSLEQKTSKTVIQ